MRLPLVLLLVVLLTVECQCRRGGGGGRSSGGRGRGGSRSRSGGSSGGGFFSWLGFGGSKSSSSSNSKPVPSAPVAPAPASNHNPIGFEHFGQGGNRHTYDHNNNMFASNTFQSGPHNYGFNKENKFKPGGIVPVPIPIPIGGGGGSSQYHHYYHGSGSYGHRDNNNNSTVAAVKQAPGDSLNPSFMNANSLNFPYKPGYMFPKPGDEDPNGTAWRTRRDWFLKKFSTNTLFNATASL